MTNNEKYFGMILEGLAHICIDPETESLPESRLDLKYDATDPEYGDWYMTGEQVNQVVGILAEYVGEAHWKLFEGGRNCVDGDVVYDALFLADYATSGPSYGTLAAMQEYSKEVFCGVHMVESPSEYKE